MKGQTKRKQYVEVIATNHIDGSVRPQQIIFAAGPIYDIEDVTGPTKIKTSSTHEIANRYAVVINGQDAFLYEDCGKWFVLMKS